MKRWIFCLLAVGCLILAAMPAVGAADADIVNYAVTGGNIKFDKSTGTVTDCDRSVTAANIPSAIQGVSVTSIGRCAFDGCSVLTGVTIPNSVTSIGYNAFFGCNGLTSVSIPNSVTSIGGGAFSGCSGLTGITVAESNPSYSFIDGVLFNKAVTVLHTYPGGKSGVYYSIPDSVTSIEDRAFCRCNGLTSVSIPNNVTSIGDESFSGCSGLTSVNIPDSVISIGNNAFYRCSGLTSVSIPDGVTSISAWAFEECSGLTSVSIPNSVTSIYGWAFDGCSSLTDVYYGGTEAEYKANLLPNIKNYNDSFLNATFHFQGSPNPPTKPPSPNPKPTIPNTAVKDNTALYGIAFLVLLALTLTVWALGRRRKGSD